MRRRALSAPLLVVLALGAAACADEGTAGSSAASTAATADTQAPAPTAAPGSTDAAATVPATSSVDTEVPEILRFTAPLVGGGTFEAASVAGTPLALWFWAPG